jgi:hypothetical protein
MFYHAAKKKFLFQTVYCVSQREREREREREPLLFAAIQWVTELFKFIEKVPPFSATNLWNDSRECDGGTLTKSTHVKADYFSKLMIFRSVRMINIMSYFSHLLYC